MKEEQNNPITTELAKQNVTDAVIAKLKKDFLPLKIKGVEDKEGYKAVKAARLQCRDVRVLAEKICKKGREEAIKTQKEWLAKEKEVVAQVSEVESYLKRQEDDIDAQIEAQKIRIERLLKLPGRKEQMVGIEEYMGFEDSKGAILSLTDEMILSFNDVEWNQILINAKSAKILEFEEQELKRKNQDRQEILANRTNLLMLAGAQIKVINGVRTFEKGSHRVQEDRIIELHPEAFEQERDIFEKETKSESPDSTVRQYPKTPSESYKAPVEEVKETTDEEKLWNYANALEKVTWPGLESKEATETFEKAQVKLNEVLTILRS
jgi:hypothetical protein